MPCLVESNPRHSQHGEGDQNADCEIIENVHGNAWIQAARYFVSLDRFGIDLDQCDPSYAEPLTRDEATAGACCNALSGTTELLIPRFSY
jgi:hypothetical protein